LPLDWGAPGGFFRGGAARCFVEKTAKTPLFEIKKKKKKKGVLFPRPTNAPGAQLGIWGKKKKKFRGALFPGGEGGVVFRFWAGGFVFGGPGHRGPPPWLLNRFPWSRGKRTTTGDSQGGAGGGGGGPGGADLGIFFFFGAPGKKRFGFWLQKGDLRGAHWQNQGGGGGPQEKAHGLRIFFCQGGGGAKNHQFSLDFLGKKRGGFFFFCFAGVRDGDENHFGGGAGPACGIPHFIFSGGQGAGVGGRKIPLFQTGLLAKQGPGRARGPRGPIFFE